MCAQVLGAATAKGAGADADLPGEGPGQSPQAQEPAATAALAGRSGPEGCRARQVVLQKVAWRHVQT